MVQSQRVDLHLFSEPKAFVRNVLQHFASPVLLVLLWLLLSSPALAGDGDLEWRSVDSPHFTLTYPKGLEPVAMRAIRICEEAWTVLPPIFGHTPASRIQVMILDFGDNANGSATALPYPRITLLAAPPSLDGNLNDYDDWLRLLIFHEFTHILQLDNISGLPKLINSILGRVAAPNQNMPSFVLEGGAVWAESLTSGRGRIRSALFRGLLRIQALEGRLFTIDQITHVPLRWPSASVWYMYGGHFMHWISQRYGDHTLARVHDATSDEVVPFSLNRSAIEATGQTFTDLYDAWRADLTAQAQTERDALITDGLTPVTRLTHNGQHREHPRVLSDGTILAIEATPEGPGGIYARHIDTPADAKLILKTDGITRFDTCGEHRIIFDRNQRHRGAYSFFDLYLFDRKTQSGRRLTRGARVREPGCAPNGRWAAAIQMLEGRTRLVRVDFETGTINVLHDPGAINQISFPTVSPDGLTVVATRASQFEGRDLIAVDVATGAVRSITRDTALELHARFSPDGNWLLYASDRSGIFDIYAKRWPDGPIQRVTRVLSAALDPSVTSDGRVVIRTITSDGYDLATVPFRPTEPVPPLFESPKALRPPTSAQPLPHRPYSPLETFWPTSWSPSFSFGNTDSLTSQLGIDIEAGDVAGHHALFGTFSTAPDEDALSATLSYAYRRLLPTLTASLTHNTASGNSAFFDNRYQPFRQRGTTLSLGTTLPFLRQARSASVSLRYSITARDTAENPAPPSDPLDLSPIYPQPARSAVASISVRYSDAQGYALGISSANGLSFGITARLRHPRMGGEIESTELLFDYTHYFPVWARHVLAFKLAGAFSPDREYRLRGPTQRNVFLDALDESYRSAQIRGYDTAEFSGRRYLATSLEYRLPIADIFRGPSTVPVFYRRLKLAVFSDWAQVTSEPFRFEPSAWRRSLGAEFLSEATLFWRLAFTVRLGIAHGFDENGQTQVYFFLGRWF